MLAGAAVLLALGCGLGLSTLLYFRERAARRDAEAATAHAEQLALKSSASAHLIEAKFLARNRDVAASEQAIANMSVLLKRLNPVHAADIYQEFGNIRAQQGRWQDAASLYSTAIELNPANFEHYHWAFPAMVRCHDMSGYQQLRQRALAQFGETDDGRVAERLIKDCLILPWPDGDYEFLNKLAAPMSKVDQNHWTWGYFQFAQGLLKYREGKLADAEKLIKRSLEKGNDDRNRNVQSYMILAMVLHQSGQPLDAEAMLLKGLQFARMTLPTERQLIDYIGWNDWVIAQALIDEATKLVRGGESQPRSGANAADAPPANTGPAMVGD